MRDAPDLNHDPVYVRVSTPAAPSTAAWPVSECEKNRTAWPSSPSARKHATPSPVQRRAREKARDEGFEAVVR